MSGNTVAARAPAEASITFPCFGGHVAASIVGEHRVEQALVEVRRRLEGWHRRFTRFERTSELSRLNAHPGETVQASNVMCRFVTAAVDAASATGGLVDPTLLGELEAAGYTRDLM